MALDHEKKNMSFIDLPKDCLIEILHFCSNETIWMSLMSTSNWMKNIIISAIPILERYCDYCSPRDLCLVYNKEARNMRLAEIDMKKYLKNYIKTCKYESLVYKKILNLKRQIPRAMKSYNLIKEVGLKPIKRGKNSIFLCPLCIGFVDIWK